MGGIFHVIEADHEPRLKVQRGLPDELHRALRGGRDRPLLLRRARWPQANPSTEIPSTWTTQPSACRPRSLRADPIDQHLYGVINIFVKAFPSARMKPIHGVSGLRRPGTRRDHRA